MGPGGTACRWLLPPVRPKGEALYARAEKSLAKGDVNAAVIDLKNLVQAEPQNAKARALLGQALRASAATLPLRRDRSAEGEGPGRAPEPTCWCPPATCMSPRRIRSRCWTNASPTSGAAGDKPPADRAGQRAAGPGRAAEAKPCFEARLRAEPDNLDALLGLASAPLVKSTAAAARMPCWQRRPPTSRRSAYYWLALGGINTSGRRFRRRRNGVPEGGGQVGKEQAR